jgi:hypothetical protein
MRSMGRCRRRRDHRFDVRRRTSAGRWPAIRCSFWRAKRQTRSPERTPDRRLDVTRLSALSAKPEKAARRKQHHRWRSSDCSTAETRTNVHASGLAAKVTTRSAAFIQFLANQAHARSVGSLAWLPAPCDLFRFGGKSAQVRDFRRSIRHVLARACLPFQARQDMSDWTPEPSHAERDLARRRVKRARA